MTDTSDQQQGSPFFKLPREVRDTIYSYLPNRSFRYTDASEERTWLLVHGYVRPSLCLVNRQFSSEYPKQILRDTRLEIYTWIGDKADLHQAISSNWSLFAEVRNVEVWYYDPYERSQLRGK